VTVGVGELQTAQAIEVRRCEQRTQRRLAPTHAGREQLEPRQPWIGGDPARGQQIFERALLATERRSFVVQLAYASTYAITVGDRALFVSLLREIIDGGDPDPDARMGNRVARRRAIHLLARVDELF
jgi:hypothetical protein